LKIRSIPKRWDIGAKWNFVEEIWLFMAQNCGQSGGDSYSGWLGVKFRVNKKSASFIDIKIES
jgi:hypothetical protein